MSQNQQSSYGLGRKQRGGSVKRAREMLDAGVRADNSSQNQNNGRMPPLPRPEPTHRPESGRGHSQEGNVQVVYQVEHDPRGPVPILPVQGLQVPKHTEPPSTSRRGPPPVYSHLNATSVSPIPEENFKKLKKKKESYASSTVIPSSWGSGPPMSEILDSYASEQEEPKRKRDSVVLLRQASLGKRGKPSLRTINKPETEAPLLHEKSNKSNDSNLGFSTVNVLERRASLDSVSTDTDSIDLEKEMIQIENEQKARSIGIGLGLGLPGAGMSSRKPNSHRPPRLDMDAVRAAEVQGSLTSLPDLIRRATKVASNLERGKTASRLGILDMFDIGKEGKRGSNHRTSASLSDILASFPPPRTGTPDNSVRTSWPFPPTNATEKSRLRQMRLNSVEEAEDASKPGRRFCGMSRRLFIFICIVVFCIIAAAVIIPVVLVVVPRERDHSSTTATSTANTTATTMTCEQKLPCMNGGVSIKSGTTCACVCVDGYSGTQCGKASDGSCTTTETSESNNATIGSSLPDLLTQSESYFGIPLNETEILSLFNANNVSCTVQNALVSFGGVSSKHRRRASPTEIRDLETEPQITSGYMGVKLTRTFINRAEATETTDVPPILNVPTGTTTSAATETAGGAAVIATGTTSAPTTTASATSTAASASASVSVSAAVSQVYEFASVAVLYLFEQTRDLNATSTAQHEIDLYLLSQSIGTSSNSLEMSVHLPETFALNFSNFTITFSNGTVVGGGNGTAT
ncbi:hypothetical protein UA08_01967 [Talaromyces atroroseus]|uniref:EGF-like domain-containing protein n=1 Tax=Talaromyces atroroseus TaxID=1441469 RepID=A0A1Q5QC74_TALAT|nr:hypothetical protein UA08_01967 [Talaromyces atroroseus]OKL63481.1 hypothetical protein UA08_01967 [Talaromyces atroroseus]